MAAGRTGPSIQDELAALASRRQGPPCSVRLALDEMPDDVRQAVEDAFGDARIKGSHIADVLRNRGYRVTGPTVQRHRRGDCQCRSLTS
jgi:hypothetical protein